MQPLRQTLHVLVQMHGRRASPSRFLRVVCVRARKCPERECRSRREGRESERGALHVKGTIAAL